VLLYYITDRGLFRGSELQRREQLLAKLTEAARAGIDYIQLREKDLPSRELEQFAHSTIAAIRAAGSRTRVLINSRTDVAFATDADGTHLRSNDISPADVRRIWRTAGARSEAVVVVSCHRDPEVLAAEAAGADFVVFGPVFEKSGTAGAGPHALRKACGHRVPVLALGGVTRENARQCLEAGAAGVAGIRIFQEGDLASTVAELRG
jgi:thiamine-phosphate pyrophosphorylase